MGQAVKMHEEVLLSGYSGGHMPDEVEHGNCLAVSWCSVRTEAVGRADTRCMEEAGK